MALEAPNYTQIPNIIIDEWLDKLSGLQLKVLVVICRKTFGWHKATDRISLSQLMKATDAARDKICDAVKALVGFGLIVKDVQGKGRYAKTFYEINIKKEVNSSQKLPSNGSQKLPTKETTPKESFSYMKSKDFEETVPLSQENESLGKLDILKNHGLIGGANKTKYPLKKEQIPIFNKLKEACLGTHTATLMVWVRIYKERELEEAVRALENEIKYGTKVHNPGGYVRSVLEGKIKPATRRSDDNRQFVKDYLKVNRWPSLEIHKDYVIDRNTRDDLIFDMPSESFIMSFVHMHEKNDQ